MGRFMNHKKWVVALVLIATALILTHLPVSEADAAASASDFQIEGSTLTKYRGSDERVTIPDTVEVVGESAFENNQKVQFVVVPKSVKRLDAYVFWGCNHLEEVVLGKGLTSVDEYAFSGCTGLKQITIPENVPVSYTHLDVYKRQFLFYAVNQTTTDPVTGAEIVISTSYQPCRYEDRAQWENLSSEELYYKSDTVSGGDLVPCLLYTSRCV